MKKISIILVAVLVASICAAVGVTVWVNKISRPPAQSSETTAEQATSEITEAESGKASESEAQTVKEEISKLDINYETTVPFEPKLEKREFKKQTDRFKLYKTVFDSMFDEATADVFFYDITHDGLADMLVLTPLVNSESQETVGKIIQLFTVTKDNTVTEIFRDYGGISTSGNGISCYITEREGEDFLLIVKDQLDEATGKLSYQICYVLSDSTVITKVTGQYVNRENTNYDSEAALNAYSAELEAQIALAHTVLFDYQHPNAVSSKAETAFGEYLN